MVSLMFRTASLLLMIPVALIACDPAPAPAAAPTASTAANANSATPNAAAIPSATAETDALVGKPAPDFTATAHDGFSVKPSLLTGKYVVVYFYPKDETPGCTKEACAFRDAWKPLESKGVVLVGISSDTIESHKQFAEHHKLPFHLVSDADGSIAAAFGVPNRGGMLGRQSFVIGPDGRITNVYRTVDVTKHADEILRDVSH